MTLKILAGPGAGDVRTWGTGWMLCRPFTNREGRARLDLDKEIKTDHKFSKGSLRLNQR